MIELKSNSRLIIRTDGTIEPQPVKITSFEPLYEKLGCDTFDVVRLRHTRLGLIMLVDDNGHIRADKQPVVNKEATLLYWANCIPGTRHPIVGDVYICPDEDFE